MLQLPNNCRAGKITVFPSNWKTVRANAKLTWRIKYRFYDDNLNQVKQVVIKGMNDFTSLAEKQVSTQVLLDDEIDQILHQGYNRITKTYSIKNELVEISEETLFYDALQHALEKINCDRHTLEDIRSCLRYIKLAADALRYTLLPIGKIKKRNIVFLLEKCGELKQSSNILIDENQGKIKKGIWSANNYNKYRTNLGILYKYLKKIDVVEANLPLEIEKEKGVKKIREVLTLEQRAQINEVIFKNDRYFWRFLHIFFHSGSRITEMLALKPKDIDLDRQRFKVLVKKGKEYREEWRTIKTVVVHLWKEVLSEAKKDDYLFSEGLQPGDKEKPIRREQVTRRWLNHVKKPLNITADFYSLKHSNLDETAELLSVEDASKMAGHTSTVITMRHYLPGEKARQHNRLKDVTNKF